MAGPPDPDFAKEFGANWFLIQAMRALSFKIRRKAKRRRVTYSFLFTKASGDQLRELGSVIDSGATRPVVDRVFPFITVSAHLGHEDAATTARIYGHLDRSAGQAAAAGSPPSSVPSPRR